jgi:hypothetical protein
MAMSLAWTLAVVRPPLTPGVVLAHDVDVVLVRFRVSDLAGPADSRLEHLGVLEHRPFAPDRGSELLDVACARLASEVTIDGDADDVHYRVEVRRTNANEIRVSGASTRSGRLRPFGPLRVNAGASTTVAWPDGDDGTHAIAVERGADAPRDLVCSRLVSTDAG